MMTNREFYEMVTLFVNDSDLIVDKDELGERLIAKAKEEIAKLDKRNADRKSKPSKKSIENAPIIKALGELLTEEPQTASELAEKCEISVPKASALLKKVEGVKITDVKVTGKGTRKAYSL